MLKSSNAKNCPPRPKLESSDILALSERKCALTLPMVTTNHDFRTKFNADLHIFNFIVIKTQGSHQKNRIAHLEVCNWSTKLVHLQLSPQSQTVHNPFDLYIDCLWMPGNKGSVHASPRLNRKHKAQAQLKPSPQCRPDHKTEYFRKELRTCSGFPFRFGFAVFFCTEFVRFVDPEENRTTVTVTHP